MKNEPQTLDFDTIAVWQAAHKQRSEDLRAWLGETPPEQPKEQAQPFWRGAVLGRPACVGSRLSTKTEAARLIPGGRSLIA
jgi:hypothetical protein